MLIIKLAALPPFLLDCNSFYANVIFVWGDHVRFVKKLEHCQMSLSLNNLQKKLSKNWEFLYYFCSDDGHPILFSGVIGALNF
jgi:hypothetical protein